MVEFFIKQPGTVTNSLMMLERLYEVGNEVLGMSEGLPNLGPFTLGYEVGMDGSCSTLILSLGKGIYTGHLKWYSMRKYSTTWKNLYEAGYCGGLSSTRDKYKIRMLATDFPTRGTWFVKFMRG